MILGCHVSFKSDGLYGSARQAISYGANAFMFYTGAPQNVKRNPISLDWTNKAHALLEENNISMQHVICHAPYIVNLANKSDIEKWQFSIDFLKGELKRCEELGVSFMVLHPGSAVGISREEGILNIIQGLNEILKMKSSCMILLETMAGKGNECGRTLEEIKEMLEGIHYQAGVCLDTCHLHDSGVSISDFDTYLKKFNEEIGLSYVKCIHLNDSKNVLGSHKDRHENIGYGTIGFDALYHVLMHPLLEKIPKILETPFVGKESGSKEREYPPYKFEIEALKKGIFDDALYDHIREFYK